MANPSTARLWASARRGADRDVCAYPAATGCRVGVGAGPKAAERRRVRHPGGLFFRPFLLAEQKKWTQGAGAEPPAISF